MPTNFCLDILHSICLKLRVEYITLNQCVETISTVSSVCCFGGSGKSSARTKHTEVCFIHNLMAQRWC